MIIAPEQLDDPADAFGRRHQPVEQRHSPGIPVNPVRAALGVHLENRVVAVEDPGPRQLDERAEIATEVRDAVDHRVWQPLGDLRLEHLGAAFDQRDDEVVRLRDPDEPVLDVEPDLRVIDMGDDEYPGVRRRALKPRLLTIRRELWMRQQRAGSGYEPAGWRHFGRKEPGGAKGGGAGRGASRSGSCRIRRRARRTLAAKLRRGAVIRHDDEVRRPSIWRRYSSVVASRCATRTRSASFSSRSESRRSFGSPTLTRDTLARHSDAARRLGTGDRSSGSSGCRGRREPG